MALSFFFHSLRYLNRRDIPPVTFRSPFHCEYLWNNNMQIEFRIHIKLSISNHQLTIKDSRERNQKIDTVTPGNHIDNLLRMKQPNRCEGQKWTKRESHFPTFPLHQTNRHTDKYREYSRCQENKWHVPWSHHSTNCSNFTSPQPIPS